jgi:hypothetical protein
VALKEHSELAPRVAAVNDGTSPPLPSREQLLDEEVFLGQLHRLASVLNPGFQATVLARICDHLSISLHEALQQDGPAQAETFFCDADLFLTECIYVDPAAHSASPVRVAAAADLRWQEAARPQDAEGATLTAGGKPIFSRARSAGNEERVGPAPWPAQLSALDEPVATVSEAMMRRRAAEGLPGGSGEGRAGGGAGFLGFTRSRSAADGDSAWGEIGGGGLGFFGFTRSRSAAGGEGSTSAGEHSGGGGVGLFGFTRSRSAADTEAAAATGEHSGGGRSLPGPVSAATIKFRYQSFTDHVNCVVLNHSSDSTRQCQYTYVCRQGGFYVGLLCALVACAGTV